jgi:hypothetical protein
VARFDLEPPCSPFPHDVAYLLQLAAARGQLVRVPAAGGSRALVDHSVPFQKGQPLREDRLGDAGGALAQLDRNVEEAAAAFRSGSASFEQSIRALQGVREAVRQRLDARAPGDVDTRILVTWPGSDPEAEGTPVRLRADDYWQGIPQKFRDVGRYRAERIVRLRFAAVKREAGDPPDQEVRVRETATGALAWASEYAAPTVTGGDE